MTFIYNGQTYKIVFERTLEEITLKHKPRGIERPRTTVGLFRSIGDKKWVEVQRASCRQYFKDHDTKEEARRVALRRLTPFILPELRPKMWEAYMTRKER